MPATIDGPRSPLFEALPLGGNIAWSDLAPADISEHMAANIDNAPVGECVSWGIPFAIADPILLRDEPVSVGFEPVSASWLVLMHTADLASDTPNEDGFYPHARGRHMLGDHVADYVFLYADGSEERSKIRRAREIGWVARGWGDVCFECVAHHKPYPLDPHRWSSPGTPWGGSQMRINVADNFPWTNWLWAWENPRSEAPIVGVLFEPRGSAVVVSAMSSANAGKVSSHPLRWLARR